MKPNTQYDVLGFSVLHGCKIVYDTLVDMILFAYIQFYILK